MASIRQLMQTSPARSNDLFAKLLDTSEGAVKTRQRLLEDLKEELSVSCNSRNSSSFLSSESTRR